MFFHGLYRFTSKEVEGLVLMTLLSWKVRVKEKQCLCSGEVSLGVEFPKTKSGSYFEKIFQGDSEILGESLPESLHL